MCYKLVLLCMAMMHFTNAISDMMGGIYMPSQVMLQNTSALGILGSLYNPVSPEESLCWGENFDSAQDPFCSRLNVIQ
jgi:hypothetical protein